jgi:site-specific DNA-cytosine methylase
VFSVEIMPDYADTYKKNFPFHELIQKDISIISEKEILSKVD